MTKDVLLCIQGLQFEEEAQNDEELDKIETICAGEYYYRNNAHYILYEELVEGMEEPIKNMIKVRGNEFSLTKRGGVNVQMILPQGKKPFTEYATPDVFLKESSLNESRLISFSSNSARSITADEPAFVR